MIKSFKEVNDPGAALVIIGEGDLKGELISLAEALHVSKQAFFLGAIANEELPPYYAMADVLALPSMPPESFGMVLIEAMACGTPVVASDLAGVRVVVSDGQDGFLIEPGNTDQLRAKIRFLLDNPQQRLEMGRSGRAKVEKRYSWSVATEKLEQVYFSILAGKKEMSEVLS